MGSSLHSLFRQMLVMTEQKRLGARKGQRRIPWEAGQGRGSETSCQELAGLKVSASGRLSDHSRTHQPPPAKASFHAELFIIATGQHAPKRQNPPAWGRGDR